MKAPRDLARAQSGARQLGRVAAPAVPALAGHAALRDLTDLNVWEDSIRRSRLRRDVRERHLNFGPVTGKRLAVPMAMLAAGLLVRDAVTDDGSGTTAAVAPPDARRPARAGGLRARRRERLGGRDGSGHAPPDDRASLARPGQAGQASQARPPGED